MACIHEINGGLELMKKEPCVQGKIPGDQAFAVCKHEGLCEAPQLLILPNCKMMTTIGPVLCGEFS